MVDLRETEKGFILEELLSRTQLFLATDSRDKIIALPGLVSSKDEVGTAVLPRYDLSASDYYRDVTGTIVKQQRSLHPLDEICNGSHDAK